MSQLAVFNTILNNVIRMRDEKQNIEIIEQYIAKNTEELISRQYSTIQQEINWYRYMSHFNKNI